MTKHSKVLILGAGPAGYTAGIYAGRAMLAPRLIAGVQPGGQLTITTEVENYPGFDIPIGGPELVNRMASQAISMGTDIVTDTIISADLSQKPFRLVGDSGTTYTSDALIIATGAQAKWLGLPSEQQFRGYGVSACATCDGFFFRSRKVVVVGGGNTAAEEALFLTNFASSVELVHRRDSLRADQILQQRLRDNPKIKLRWNSEVVEILGGGPARTVKAVTLKNTVTGAVETIDTDGVFVAIGHSPATSLFADQLPMKDAGYLATMPGSTATLIPGVFAAGDVTDNIYRQAVTAAGMGAMAAIDAERFLALTPMAEAA